MKRRKEEGRGKGERKEGGRDGGKWEKLRSEEDGNEEREEIDGGREGR